MATREHWSSDGKVHVKVSTIHTNLAAYVEWGAEAWRYKKHRIVSVWWQPWTWGRTEWRQEGSPGMTDVAFLRGGDNLRIPDTTLNPAATNQPGYQKVSVTYVFVSGPDPTDLGNDARAVARVVATYTWNGQTKTLQDP